MAQRPPPFSALRTLEAAARLRSYTAAAAELMVTHSAVSQAIRRLEEDLGAKLFYRRGSFMEPAPSTLVLARAYHEAAQHLSRSLVDIAGRNTPDKLVVSLPPGLARLWLSPRLPRLSAAFPGVSCDLRTTRELASLALQLHGRASSESMGDHDSEVMGCQAHRSRRHWNYGRLHCGM